MLNLNLVHVRLVKLFKTSPICPQLPLPMILSETFGKVQDSPVQNTNSPGSSELDPHRSSRQHHSRLLKFCQGISIDKY